MSAYTLFAGTLVTDGRSEKNVALKIEDGKIVGKTNFNPQAGISEPDIDARHLTVMPGMIDIHIHGGKGRDLMEGTEDAVFAVGEHLLSHGVTGFLVTPLTAPWEAIAQSVRAGSSARKQSPSSKNHARILGAHIEGPYINPKLKGAQPPEHIVPPDIKQFETALDGLLDEVKIVTLAPEMEGAEKLIRYLEQNKIVVSIGHTDATYDQVTRAIDWGARHATHCYNAMRGLHHREPGTVGAVMAHPELKAELIWDNIHVHPMAAKALINAKSAEGVICISDGTTGVGMPDGYRFELWGHEAVIGDNAARLLDGTLAGSAVGMDSCLRNAAQVYDLETASLLCCANPARALGLYGKYGTLSLNAIADFILLNDRQEVQMVFLSGERAWNRETSNV